MALGRILKGFAVLSLLMGLAGCASTVATQVNAFRSPSETLGRGSVWVTAADAETGKSLEFAWYRTQVEQALVGVGYRLAESQPAADYRASVAYFVDAIESSDAQLRSVGYLHYPYRYFGSNIGVVVVDDQRRPQYQRGLRLVIEKNTEAAERVYEVSGLSRGRCGVMSKVFPDMLTALLDGFPSDNASVRTVSVRSDARC